MSSPNAKYMENFSESEEKMLALPEVWNFVERSIGKMKMQLRPIDWCVVKLILGFATADGELLLGKDFFVHMV